MHAFILSLTLSIMTPIHQPAASAPTAATSVGPEGRTLQHSGVVNTSAEELWKTFTTVEGWTSTIGVAKTEIDFRLGGTIKSVYDKNATIGDDSTIINTILAYEPGRMIALKATAPKNAPESIKSICETGWSVIRFEPLTQDRTRLTITGLGYQDTELHNAAYKFFEQGNSWTLKKIQDHFATPAQTKAVDDAEKLMFRMNGTWSFSKDAPDGTKFRGTTEGKILFDGKLLVADGSLTVGDKTFHHSHFICGRDPATNALRAWSFNEHGDVTEGQVHIEGDKKIIVDWDTHHRSDGRFVDYRIEYTFNGPDEFHCLVLNSLEADGTRKTLADITYKRVTNTAVAK